MSSTHACSAPFHSKLTDVLLTGKYKCEMPFLIMHSLCQCRTGSLGTAEQRPGLLADSIRHIADACSWPLCTGLHWLTAATNSSAGVDDADSYDELCSFVQTVSQQSGVRHLVIHSRKCLLRGLSPAQNRTVPKLK